MGVRSLIVLCDNNKSNTLAGSGVAITSQAYGWASGVGRMLADNYTDIEKVRCLLSRGSVYFLREKVFSDKKDDPKCTVAWVDKGITDNHPTQKISWVSERDLADQIDYNFGVEFVYLGIIDGGNVIWDCYSYSHFDGQTFTRRVIPEKLNTDTYVDYEDMKNYLIINSGENENL